jgi:hypothetical protein
MHQLSNHNEKKWYRASKVLFISLFIIIQTISFILVKNFTSDTTQWVRCDNNGPQFKDINYQRKNDLSTLSVFERVELNSRCGFSQDNVSLGNPFSNLPRFSFFIENHYSLQDKILYHTGAFLVIDLIFFIIARIFFYIFQKEDFLPSTWF